MGAHSTTLAEVDTGIGLYAIRREGAFLGCCGLIVGHSDLRPWNDASFHVLDKAGIHRSGRVTTDDFGDSVWCARSL